MSITITVPNDDHVALRAMAKALEEIAVARGAPAQDIKPEWMKTAEKDAQFWKKAATMLRADDVDGSIEIHGERKQAEIDTTSQQVESLALFKIGDVTLAVHEESDDLEPISDSTDTPWDERIHSASKALNSDGTWRLRRKPADKTPEEWTAYVKWVEEDIHTVQQGESDESGVCPENIDVMESEPLVTPVGDDFHVDAGEVTEQEIASIPVPPLPVPPVFATVQEVDEVPAMTFPQVMQFLTERHGRISSAQVDQVIADMGLSSIMDLNTKPEHTGPFIARVKALLGE